jgi:CBS domain containing-hemolysin-like protein
MVLLLFYLFLALSVSFLCSILEAVLLSLTPSYIASLPEESRHRRVLERLKRDLDEAISAILVLNTIAHTMGAAGVGAEAVRVFGIQWQTLIAVVLTLLILYVSEIIPKTIGATYWRELARPAGYIIAFLIKALGPMLWLSHQITKRVQKKNQGPTRDEISAMAEIGEQYGILHANEGRLIENLMRLRDVQVGEILTPRSVVFSLDADTTIASALEDDRVFIYSRIPVWEGDRDRVIGKVFGKEVLRANAVQEDGSRPLRSIMVPVYRVPERMPVYFLLDLFITRREHLFVVHDEFRQFSGIVTLEDAIETLLGREILDEADEAADMQQVALERARHWKHFLEHHFSSTPGSGWPPE